MATIKSLPAETTATIIQGSPWPGVIVQYMDQSVDPAVPMELEVTAQVRTDTVARGGVLLAECDVTVDGDPADYRYLVSLDATATGDLPERQVFIEIDAARDGGDPESIWRITAVVEGEINA